MSFEVSKFNYILSHSFNSSKNARNLLLDEVLIISQQSWLILKGFTSQFVNILLIFTNLDRLCLPLPLYTDMLSYIISCNKVLEHKGSVKMSHNLSPLRQSFRFILLVLLRNHLIRSENKVSSRVELCCCCMTSY